MPTLTTRSLFLLWLIVWCGFAGNVASAQSSPAEVEFFEKRVRPILAENCYSCHSADSKPIMGGLRLDSREGMLKGGGRGPMLAPGQPENSLLIKAIRYTDKALQMPPTGRMSDEKIDTLVEWVKRGAALPANVSAASSGRVFDLRARARHWAWQPIRRPAIPVVKQKDWLRNPIDAFILAKLEARGIAPARPADRRTLLRRVTYDLIGLPPTSDEIHAFLADKSPHAYEKVVDRLLASPHYGERWARHWLDLVRYAETDGHEWDIEKTGAYQYRDYLIRAFNADVPYNQFVMEQIAGDLMPHPRLNPVEGFNESVLGTGFYWLGAAKHSPVDLRDDEAERVDNQIDVLSKTFQGIGVGCARCHDHKFDAVSTKDYYALYGFLKCARMQEAPVGPPLSATLRSQLLTVRDSVQRILWQDANIALAQAGDRTRPEWNARLEASRRDSNAILTPYAALSAENATRSPEAFSKARETLVQQMRAQTEKSQRENQAIVWLNNFGASGANSRWSSTGEAFNTAPVSFPTARMEGENAPHVAALFPSGAADSGSLSDKLQGVLRSPTFTIEKPYILYHLAGRNARVRLVIQGYQLIRDPIYGSLAFDINSPDKMIWRSQDVRSWIGERAYIEIVDDGGGFAAVDRVGFSDGGPPSEAPNPLIVAMLDDPTLTSLDALAARYATLFRQTAENMTVGVHTPKQCNAHTPNTQNPTPNTSGQWALRCWALQTAPLPPTDARRLADLLAQRKTLEAKIAIPQPALATTDGTGEDEHVHLRGNYRTPGVEAPRRFLEACDGAAPLATGESSGRLLLAQRMIAPSNPLLARVMVNRLWEHHFGEGIVRTPDDFGVMGERPTNPQLLDWLAATFRAQGWSLKKMHRLMVLSSAYRMDSQASPQAEAADPQNRLLHRAPIRRLEAECIRDAILAVSGRLDPTLYGPPVMPYLSAFTPGRGAPPSGPLDGAGRRSIYLAVRRNFLIPMFLAFDYPVPTTTMGRRTVSNVPAQALVLLNNPFVVEMAQVWAKRERTQPGPAEAHINRLYETAFGRLPRPAERDAALEFLKDQSHTYGSADDPRLWADLCHVLFNVKEFIFLR